MCITLCAPVCLCHLFFCIYVLSDSIAQYSNVILARWEEKKEGVISHKKHKLVDLRSAVRKCGLSPGSESSTRLRILLLSLRKVHLPKCTKQVVHELVHTHHVNITGASPPNLQKYYYTYTNIHEHTQLLHPFYRSGTQVPATKSSRTSGVFRPKSGSSDGWETLADRRLSVARKSYTWSTQCD